MLPTEAAFEFVMVPRVSESPTATNPPVPFCELPPVFATEFVSMLMLPPAVIREEFT